MFTSFFFSPVWLCDILRVFFVLCEATKANSCQIKRNVNKALHILNPLVPDTSPEPVKSAFFLMQLPSVICQTLSLPGKRPLQAPPFQWASQTRRCSLMMQNIRAQLPFTAICSNNPEWSLGIQVRVKASKLWNRAGKCWHTMAIMGNNIYTRAEL